MSMHKKSRRSRTASANGFALAVTMLSLVMLTGLGLAVVVNSSGDLTISGHLRRNEQAFFAAEAGLNIAREALRVQLNQTIQNTANAAAASITFPGSGQSFNDSQLTNLLTASSLSDPNGTMLTSVRNAVSSRAASLGAGSNFNVNITFNPEGSPTIGTRLNPVGGIAQPPTTIRQRYRYVVTATGSNNLNATSNPFGSTAQVSEQGFITLTLNPVVASNSNSNTTFNRAFSAYGSFYNVWRQSAVVASGTFSGPTHANNRFRFSSSNSVTFRDAVTQSGTNYDYGSSQYNVTNQNRTGLTFQSTFTRVDPLPLPQNVYAQQLAVLNSTGQVDSTFTNSQPTAQQLSDNLRDPWNNKPAVSGSNISNGVYVSSSDGSNVTGGGIYVQGNADDVQLHVTGTNTQVYTIRQGSNTTTVTIVPPSGSAAGSTTIARGSQTRTFTGVPKDKTNPTAIRDGASVFVNGAITSLHGPARSGSNPTGPAIGAKTAVTITATGNVTITGDLKYQEPVLNTDGTQTANGLTRTNVLGVFTNTGRIDLSPSSTYSASNLSMVLDVALVAFNEPALNVDPNAITGGVQGVCSSCTSSSVVIMRGSRTVSKSLSAGNFGRYDRFHDPRFANGAFAPPFFPVTQLTNTNTTTYTFAVTFTTSDVATESNTWQRMNY